MNFLDNALFLLFPTVCGICGKINRQGICPDCYRKIFPKIIAKADNYENDKSKYYEEHIYLFLYETIIREKIIDYKFQDKAYLADMFCKFFVKNKKICGILEKYDIIIPVPISKKRWKQRGYNQSALIAKKISKQKNINYANILQKEKDNLAQSSLNRKQRIQNVKGVYKLQNTQTIKEKKILILDDVYTTGSTANECAKVLKQARSRESGHSNNCKRYHQLK